LVDIVEKLSHLNKSVQGHQYSDSEW